MGKAACEVDRPYAQDLRRRMMDSQKVSSPVTPAKAGVYKLLITLDSGFHRNDEKRRFWTFYESNKNERPTSTIEG
jgi:hypothetical protein